MLATVFRRSFWSFPRSAHSMNWPAHAPKHRINDVVYGTVRIPSPIDKIIDTEEFQRLRNLKQTGLVYLVYPNCEQSRFVHSLGTFSLAFNLVDKLRHSQQSLGITSAEHCCTAIAALLHDVGHGPFSHLFDGEFAKRCGRSFKHEEMSVKLIDRIMRKPEIRAAFEPIIGAGAGEDYDQSIKFIQEQISSRPTDFLDGIDLNALSPEEREKRLEQEWAAVVEGRGVKKSFLYDIVSNAYCGHDVDKMDYLLRDAIASGVSITFSMTSLNRLLDHVRVVIDPNSGLRRIGYSKKCDGDIKSIGESRQELHSKVYQHKTVRFIENMVVEALISAGELLLYKGSDGQMLPLTMVTEDVEAFLKTSDFVEAEILNSTSTDPRMLHAQSELRKVKHREIGCKLGSFEMSPDRANHHGVTNNEIGANEVVKMVQDAMDRHLKGELAGKYRVMHSVLGRGLDEKTHPIQRQVFYDGKPCENEGEPMIGCYVDEDYVHTNCPKMATKWEIFVMGDRNQPQSDKDRIRAALPSAAESLSFLTPRKRSPPQDSEETSLSSTGPSAKRALVFSSQ
ncbi:unnamed protein product [Caenorhabditis sp. 36 PRJEB53466]|nr:unnamed protein product [Caenorhabditis sp. 36 PRJEB53466]